MSKVTTSNHGGEHEQRRRGPVLPALNNLGSSQPEIGNFDAAERVLRETQLAPRLAVAGRVTVPGAVGRFTLEAGTVNLLSLQ